MSTGRRRTDLPIWPVDGRRGIGHYGRVDQWLEVARSGVERGATHDEIASDLIARGAGPLNAMKAMRSVLGINLGEAKRIVHPKLTPAEQASAEQLWDALSEASREME